MALTEKQREILGRPFPQSVKSKDDRGLLYVDGIHYVTRFNEVFEGEWFEEVLKEEFVTTPGKSGSETVEWCCFLRLTAAGITHYHWGCQAVRGSQMTSGEARKAAKTDAFKKAASLFGIDPSLYSKAPLEDTKEEPPQPKAESPKVKDKADLSAYPAPVQDLVKLLYKQTGWGVKRLAEACEKYSGKKLEQLAEDELRKFGNTVLAQAQKERAENARQTAKGGPGESRGT